MTAWTNYHSHTHYCDGSSTPEDYIKAALAKGIAAYGFSSHVPLPFACAWSVKEERVQDYLAEIDDLKKKYEGQLDIYKSLEIDYIPDIIGPQSDYIKKLSLDYTLGSVHFVGSHEGRHWEIDGEVDIFKWGLVKIYNHDIRAAVTRYYELTRQMVREHQPDIIGHLDKIKMQNDREHFFAEDADWYVAEIENTLDVIAEEGGIVEVNTRGMYKGVTIEPYPSYWVLEEVHARNIPIQLNSDGHKPEEIIAEFETVAPRLLEIGFTEMRVIIGGEWKDVSFTAKGLNIPQHA